MLVTTANAFLMRQFSQGRMSVDTIKKTVDGWRNKGRPIVTQFMYDQATQRDLIAVNQDNFQFHGERAGDGIRVNSMLYNWKQVASLMCLRTFCNTDTVMVKLLFDAEQILELLGASEDTMFRLQQIRAQVNETLRVGRQCNDSQANKNAFQTDRGVSLMNQYHGEGMVDGKQPNSDAYGGMKLVPDSYSE